MRYSILTLAIACACGGGTSSTPDAPGSSSDDAAGGEDVIAPGTWRYAQYNVTQDSCDGTVDGDGGFTVEIVANGFKIVRSGSPSSTCTVDDDANFECITPTEVQDLNPADAVLTGRLNLSGHLTNTTLASGTQSFVVTCAGSECNTVDPGACSVTATVALAKQ